MVQIIMAIIKVAWLASSYALIFGYIGDQIPNIVAWAITVFSWMEYIIPFLTSAIGTIKWLIGTPAFNFCMWAWIALPFLKFTIYWSYKGASFGGLVAHSIDSGNKSSNSN